MSLRAIYGHRGLLNRLGSAIASGRFPQSALLVGSRGVGKQRLALWIAETLLCDRSRDRPCGECESCRLAHGIGHPDLHWFVPITRPKAGDPDKQVAEARDLLGEAIGERRDGLTPPVAAMTSHPLASVRLLQRTTVMKPFRGPRKVIVLGDAERLVVQEASQEAANALLKVLEEPPANTTIILTAAEPQALLPTIRSRVVPIRVGRVTDDDVAAFLRAETSPAPDAAALERRVVLAAGSIGLALWSDDRGGTAERAAASFLESVRAGPRRQSEAALAQAPWSARGGFSEMLDALAVSLRGEAQHEAQAGDASSLEQRVRAMRRVEEIRADAAGNLNPQLALAVLARDLEPLV